MDTKIVSAKYPNRLAKIISKVCSLFLPIHLIQNPNLPLKMGALRFKKVKNSKYSLKVLSL